MPITQDDVKCLQSAIRVLEDEGYNDNFLNPKRRLLAKLKFLYTLDKNIPSSNPCKSCETCRHLKHEDDEYTRTYYCIVKEEKFIIAKFHAQVGTCIRIEHSCGAHEYK